MLVLTWCRPILLTGALMMALFLFILGGLSTLDNPSQAARNMSVSGPTVCMPWEMGRY
jgi:hypothetical protein